MLIGESSLLSPQDSCRSCMPSPTSPLHPSLVLRRPGRCLPPLSCWRDGTAALRGGELLTSTRDSRCISTSYTPEMTCKIELRQILYCTSATHYDFLRTGFLLILVKEKSCQYQTNTDSTLRPQVCLSYPEEAIVPSSVSDERLARVVKFRQNGRFPVISYHHQ